MPSRQRQVRVAILRCRTPAHLGMHPGASSSRSLPGARGRAESFTLPWYWLCHTSAWGLIPVVFSSMPDQHATQALNKIPDPMRPILPIDVSLHSYVLLMSNHAWVARTGVALNQPADRMAGPAVAYVEQAER